MRTIADITITDLSPAEMAIAPKTFKDLACLVPVAEAIAVCEAIGGQEIRVPERADTTPKNLSVIEIKRLMKQDSFARLVEAWGGTRQFIPSLARVKVARLHAEIIGKLCPSEEPVSGGALRQVVEDYGISVSYAWRLVKKHRTEVSGAKPAASSLRKRSARDLGGILDGAVKSVVRASKPPIADKISRAVRGRSILAGAAQR